MYVRRSVLSTNVLLQVEEEFIAVLREKVPKLMQTETENMDTDNGGLGTIRCAKYNTFKLFQDIDHSEGLEETEELSQMSEGNSQSQTSLSRSRSVSQARDFLLYFDSCS